MVRTGLFTALWLGLLLAYCLGRLPGAPPADKESALNTTLALQQAMATAKDLVRRGDNKKAVAVLEEQLPRVDGNTAFLRLLRDAYRGYIKDLSFANDSAGAKRYLDRLCILEPSAAADGSLRPPEATAKITPPERKGLLSNLPAYLPNFGLNHPRKEANASGPSAKPAPMRVNTVRAKADDAAADDDPFALANMAPASAPAAPSQHARQLVSRAEQEFEHRRFLEARKLYDQAYQADKTCIDASRDRWAYCILDQVVAQLNQPAPNAPSLNDLQQQVQTALVLAPILQETGKSLLREIDQRSKAQATAATPEAIQPLAVQHLGRNKEGWQVAETPYFLIFHNQSREQIDKIAAIAESTRRAMYRKWFDTDGIAWSPKCELILHPTGAEYSRTTGVSSNSPGHSRIELDPSGQRVVSRRMELRCDNPGMMDGVLPHETTHVVLAGMFGKHNVPRWADEGIAVLTEPPAKVDQHRRNLEKSRQEGALFGVQELMQLQDYPQPRRIGAFYAESVCLVEFMAELRGPRVFTAFIRDGLRDGYEDALRKHYGIDMNELQQRFDTRGEGRVARGE